jgi:hypothetical protein
VVNFFYCTYLNKFFPIHCRSNEERTFLIEYSGEGGDGIDPSCSQWDTGPVLPTLGKGFLPNDPKNSAAEEKIRPKPLFSIKENFVYSKILGRTVIGKKAEKS